MPNLYWQGEIQRFKEAFKKPYDSMVLGDDKILPLTQQLRLSSYDFIEQQNKPANVLQSDTVAFTFLYKDIKELQKTLENMKKNPLSNLSADEFKKKATAANKAIQEDIRSLENLRQGIKADQLRQSENLNMDLKQKECILMDKIRLNYERIKLLSDIAELKFSRQSNSHSQSVSPKEAEEMSKALYWYQNDMQPDAERNKYTNSFSTFVTKTAPEVNLEIQKTFFEKKSTIAPKTIDELINTAASLKAQYKTREQFNFDQHFMPEHTRKTLGFLAHKLAYKGARAEQIKLLKNCLDNLKTNTDVNETEKKLIIKGLLLTIKHQIDMQEKNFFKSRMYRLMNHLLDGKTGLKDLKNVDSKAAVEKFHEYVNQNHQQLSVSYSMLEKIQRTFEDKDNIKDFDQKTKQKLGFRKK